MTYHKASEGRITFNLTTVTLPTQIAETRDRLEAWISSLEAPSKASGMEQVLRMVSCYPLTYEVYLQPI